MQKNSEPVYPNGNRNSFGKRNRPDTPRCPGRNARKNYGNLVSTQLWRQIEVTATNEGVAIRLSFVHLRQTKKKRPQRGRC